MKRVVLAGLLLLSLPAFALEVGGAKLDDGVEVGNAQLVLNGAGVRSVFMFDMYVAGLYLSGKKHTAEAVLADRGAKRIALHVVRAGDTSRFLRGFRSGIEKNRGLQGMAVLHDRMTAFDHLFDAVRTLEKNDVIAFDWQPSVGTRVSLNDKELGRVGGEDFYRALLSIWIGEKPVEESLKKELLGD